MERRVAVAAHAMSWRYAAWAIIGVGIVLRVARYAYDKSLWLDESYLALNFIDRPFGHLFGTLDYNQGAPLGFLVGEKAVVQVAGDSEYALRFLPFVAGIASLFLFYFVARELLSRGALLIALALFATLEPFIYYSAETKQYGFDVLTTLALVLVLVHVVRTDGVLTARRAGLLALAGLLAVWLSHPAVFMLLGLAVAASIRPLLRRDWSVLVMQGIVYAVWLASFLVTYVLSIRKLGGLQESVLPNEGHAASPSYMIKNIYLIFSDPAGLPRTVAGLSVLLALVGAVVIARQWFEVPLMVATATFVGYVAAELGKYPMNGRFILFLLPTGVLFIGAGIDALLVRKNIAAVTAGIAAAALIGIPAVGDAAKHLVSPPQQEEVQPLLSYVSTRWEPGETLYVHNWAAYAVRYYLVCHDCDGLSARQRQIWHFRLVPPAAPQSTPALASGSRSVVVGTGTGRAMANLDADIRKLRGRGKTWVLFTHYFPLTKSDIYGRFGAVGQRLDCTDRGVAFVCLYDFPAAPKAAKT